MDGSQKNTYVTVLKILGGTIIVLGVIGSLALGRIFEIPHGVTYTYYEYNYYILFAGVLSSVITGALVMGMGELIRLTYETSLNTRLLLEQARKMGTAEPEAEDEELPEL